MDRIAEKAEQDITGEAQIQEDSGKEPGRSESGSYSLQKRWIAQKNPGYLPNSLPYQVQEEEKTMAQPGKSDRDRVEIWISGQRVASWDYNQIADKRITLQYVPATDTDREILSGYGTLFEVPAYLV